jgi:hypothetical protein
MGVDVCRIEKSFQIGLSWSPFERFAGDVNSIEDSLRLTPGFLFLLPCVVRTSHTKSDPSILPMV